MLFRRGTEESKKKITNINHRCIPYFAAGYRESIGTYNLYLFLFVDVLFHFLFFFYFPIQFVFVFGAESKLNKHTAFSCL